MTTNSPSSLIPLTENSPKSISVHTEFVTKDRTLVSAICRLPRKFLSQPADQPLLVTGPAGCGKKTFLKAASTRIVESRWMHKIVHCEAIDSGQTLVDLLNDAPRGDVLLINIDRLAHEVQLQLPLLARRKRQVRIMASASADHAKDLDFLHSEVKRLFGTRRVFIPPLQQRREDIVVLAEHFLAKEDTNLFLDRQTIEKLKGCRWPGNARELQLIIRALVLACDKHYGARIEPTILDELLLNPDWLPAMLELAHVLTQCQTIDIAQRLGLQRTEKLFTAILISKALKSEQDNVSRTAKRLRIPNSTLSCRLKVLNNELNTANKWF